jgi:transcriptional antiterminator RfaH
VNWYALYTKQKCEDMVSSRLRGIGLEVLSPKIATKKYKRYRLTEAIEPLFPCYIFVQFDTVRYHHMISNTRGVRYIVGRGNPVVVPEDIIRTINENAEGGVVLPEPKEFGKGERVLIKEGAFKDFYGIFVNELRGRERVTILLEMLGYRIEIDKYFVGKAN